MSSRVQPSSSDVPSQPLIDNTLPIDALVAAIEGKGEGEEGEGREGQGVTKSKKKRKK